MHEVLMAAPASDGKEIRDWVLVVVGNLFMGYCGYKAFRLFMKSDYGGMATFAAGAAFVSLFVWFPDAAKDFLSSVAEMVA